MIYFKKLIFNNFKLLESKLSYDNNYLCCNEITLADYSIYPLLHFAIDNGFNLTDYSKIYSYYKFFTDLNATKETMNLF